MRINNNYNKQWFFKNVLGKIWKHNFFFLFRFKISSSVSDIQTNITIKTKNINEMEKKFHEILNNLEKDLNERGENYIITILKLFI